ncbi:MAG: hypothetical protein WCE30_26040 [Mycobacterium sp.]
MTTAMLAEAAFGPTPQSWPLPRASSARELWWRAVAAGGQGRYASAQADLETLRRLTRGPLASLTLSTRASFLRQLGGHDLARTLDGQAWALATDPESRADALIGLAADALGVGRFAASDRLLQRAQPHVDDSGEPRLRVRLAWVNAELAMVSGAGSASVEHAERTVRLAASFGSARHTVKSDVVHAAALCSAGRFDESRVVADRALRAAQELGLVPLVWALCCLLADIGSADHNLADIARIRDAAAIAVRDRGGMWTGR